MFVTSEVLPADSRVWIYQSSRPLKNEEREAIKKILTDFCAEWSAHGQPIRSSYEIRYDQFIILYADESFHAASGCSIDSSVRIIKEISERLSVDFFDRTLIAFLIDGKVVTVKTAALKQFFAEGIWNDQTPTFNNLVQSKAEVISKWVVPAGSTWIKRYASVKTLQN